MKRSEARKTILLWLVAACTAGLTSQVVVAQETQREDQLARYVDQQVAAGGACNNECCNRNPTPGCSDPECEALVCEVEPLCCQFEWDLACQMTAFDLCGLEQPSDCCGFIGPGQVCSDEECVGIVCAADPFCCETSWDTLCGFEAQDLCGDLCCCETGEPEPDCTNECCNRNPTPGCSDPECEALVCEVEPLCCQFEWDLACQMTAFDLCGLQQPSDCCGFIGPGQVCSDEACVETVCAADPFCCETSWDTLCGFEAQELCGDLCCCETGAEPVVACLDIKPGSCPNSVNPGSRGYLPIALAGSDDFDVSTVDISSLSLSRADGVGGSVSPNEGPPGPHTTIDDAATPICGAEPPDEVDCTNECCNRNPTPGCSDADCEALVCAAEPVCCQFEWDLACQMIAFDLCGLEQPSDCCGFIGPGEVCSNDDCVALVCGEDPFCCETSWDTLCGFEAQELCGDLCCCETGGDGDPCACTEEEGDGIDDLVMHFKTQDTAEALNLGDLQGGTQIELCLSGVLMDGTPFEACDCIRIVPVGQTLNAGGESAAAAN